MKLKINDDYRVDSYRHGFNLVRLSTIKEGKNKGKIREVSTFHANLSQVAHHLAKENLVGACVEEISNNLYECTSRIEKSLVQACMK